MLTERYDKEQAELASKVKAFEQERTSDREQLDRVQRFIDEVSDYAGITELSYKIIHQLIDKILVFEAEEIDGEKVHKIQIYYKFIGALDTIE